jgi:signal peptidase
MSEASEASEATAGAGRPSLRRRALLVVRIASAAWTTALVALLAGLVVLVLTGWRLDVVTSPSMEPAIPQGSAVLARPVDDSALRSLEAGDVITFDYPRVDALVMHRIVEVREQGGQVFFTTQGDANAAPDARLVPGSDVEAEVRASLPIVGRILTALQPPSGVVLLVVVPLLLALARHLLARGLDPSPTDPTATERTPSGGTL